jgi:predicted molibdopterin-dependent oxidoreductase YjgC
MDLVVVQDLFLNETSKFAHVFLPGTSFLEKDGTFTNAERRINRVRPVMAAKNGKQEWQIICEISQAMGYEMHYDNAAQIMDEIAEITPTFKGVSFAMLDEVGSVQWPCNDAAPTGTPIMHVEGFVRGQGQFMETPFVPTEERSNRKFPLLLTTGRILSQYKSMRQMLLCVESLMVKRLRYQAESVKQSSLRLLAIVFQLVLFTQLSTTQQVVQTLLQQNIQTGQPTVQSSR